MSRSPEFDKARDIILNRLVNELAPALTYHSLKHTTGEVVPAVERLAGMEKVNKSDRILLLTAAYYHDSGFIEQRQGHESISIRIVEEALPVCGYTKDHIAVIRSIILATRIPQSPNNLLEKIMADADLDYLGSENFWERSKDLRLELANYGSIFTDQEWYRYQLDFIQVHRYFTDSERLVRDPLKHQHLLEIRRRLELAMQIV